ncbi:GNAT family N-acetyltransferase [Paenibacillus yanchengensis]|uniref:GNAT family N-acetyltransferase n=1 Tax=Paenibacillus yanchengensis TaxID=2035833 RepID=A0ABW4YNF0_9BACL
MSQSNDKEMSQYNIARIQTEQELSDALAVRTAVFVQEQQVPISLEVDEKDTLMEQEKTGCSHYVLYNKTTPVAAARYYMYSEKTAKLQRIAVLKTYRGQGLGKAIIEQMEQHIQAKDIAHIILDAQVTAVGFYEQLGYTKQSEQTFLDAGIVHVRMEKYL